MFIRNKHLCPNGHLCLFLINHSTSVFIYHRKTFNMNVQGIWQQDWSSKSETVSNNVYQILSPFTEHREYVYKENPPGSGGDNMLVIGLKHGIGDLEQIDLFMRRCQRNYPGTAFSCCRIRIGQKCHHWSNACYQWETERFKSTHL